MTLEATMLTRLAKATPFHAEMATRHPTEVTIESLAFYRRFDWVRILIFLPHRPLVLSYADDGAQMLFLGGTADDVYRVNRAEALQLTEGMVAPYVRFFLAATRGKSRTLAEQPSDVPWLPATECDEALKAARASASARLHPLQVSTESDRYRVSATVVQEMRLIELSLNAARDGGVVVAGTTILMEDLPVSLLI